MGNGQHGCLLLLCVIVRIYYVVYIYIYIYVHMTFVSLSLPASPTGTFCMLYFHPCLFLFNFFLKKEKKNDVFVGSCWRMLFVSGRNGLRDVGCGCGGEVSIFLFFFLFVCSRFLEEF